MLSRWMYQRFHPNLKGITKIYPHSGDQKKAKKKKDAPKKKVNL